MRKTCRYQGLVSVFGIQNAADIFSVCWRTFSNIDGHVKNGTGHDGNQLPLLEWTSLEVKAFYGPIFCHKGKIVLNELYIDATFRKFFLVIRFDKISAVIVKIARTNGPYV